LLAAALAALLAGCRREQPAAQPAAQLAESDPRIAHLLEPCPQARPYTVDTSATTEILIEVLEHGQMDPLRKAKEELASLGPDALVQVLRSAERHWKTSYGEAYVRNAIDVATLAGGETARAILLRGLAHERESVRLVALRGLRKHGLKEDFDAVYEQLRMGGEVSYLEAVAVLHSLDRPRAEALYLEWLEKPEMFSLRPVLLSAIASSEEEATIRFARERFAGTDLPVWPILAGIAARAGDGEALAALRAGLAHADEDHRAVCVQAAAECGLYDELIGTALSDASARLRLHALRVLAENDETEPRRDALLAGLNDSDPEVRTLCTSYGVEKGDASAIDRAQDMLANGPLQSLDAACRILLPLWERDPAQAQRSFELLRANDAEIDHRPLSERGRILATIGRVPLRAAAEYLAQVASASTGTLQDMSSFRWVLLRAGNTGPEGQAFLAEGFRKETDRMRRIDWLEALSAAGGDTAREELLAIAEDGSTAPLELVYAADRLVRIGPVQAVAPVLKRCALRCENPIAARALQCILWTWYPGPTP
jgi:hypothetical protein